MKVIGCLMNVFSGNSDSMVWLVCIMFIFVSWIIGWCCGDSVVSELVVKLVFVRMILLLWFIWVSIIRSFGVSIGLIFLSMIVF